MLKGNRTNSHRNVFFDLFWLFFLIDSGHCLWHNMQMSKLWKLHRQCTAERNSYIQTTQSYQSSRSTSGHARIGGGWTQHFDGRRRRPRKSKTGRHSWRHFVQTTAATAKISCQFHDSRTGRTRHAQFPRQWNDQWMDTVFKQQAKRRRDKTLW